VILPGSTIGILGGGQLGRMTGIAARSLGYDVHVLDPNPDCPAGAIASRVVAAAFDDADAAAELARGSDVVTLEIEQIGVDALNAAAALAPLRPGVAAVTIVQNRITQRNWLVANGLPVGAHRIVTSAEECRLAVEALGASIAKAPTGGYDGRGQVRMADSRDALAAWTALGEQPCVVEQFLDIELELSVLVARQLSPSNGGATVAVYPAARNHHQQGVLDWSVIPAGVPPAVAAEAERIARATAEAIDIEGLLAVELFVLRDGRVLVNELAPRPHNSYHHSTRACLTSQFEQLVRAICGLPLGATDVVAPGAISNLLGDLWPDGRLPDIAAALRVPGARVHLYGKASARPGRKMGHISALGSTTDEALARALQARAATGGR
jgi:5-(carboxyamino)imidazole ribonucleotide synthase